MSVIAEGRYNTPAQAADAMRHGVGGDGRFCHYAALNTFVSGTTQAMKKAVL